MGLRNKLLTYPMREIGADLWYGASAERVIEVSARAELTPDSWEHHLILWTNQQRSTGRESGSRNICVVQAMQRARVDYMVRRYGADLPESFYQLLRDYAKRDNLDHLSVEEKAELAITAGRFDKVFTEDLKNAFSHRGALMVLHRKGISFEEDSPVVIREKPVSTEAIDHIVALSDADYHVLDMFLH